MKFKIILMTDQVSWFYTMCKYAPMHGTFKLLKYSLTALHLLIFISVVTYYIF